MKTLTRSSLLALLAFASAFAQLNTVVQTSLSAAITSKQNQFAVASATGINAPTSGQAGSTLYVVDLGQIKGEAMTVVSLSGTTVTVRRSGPGKGSAHASGAMVLVATSPDWFEVTDPSGSCVVASTKAAPWVNIQNGYQWICSAKTLTWTAGWGNPAGSPQALSATATASYGGATAIAGPFVEMSGTAQITAFTMSVGWNGQGFCISPTGAYTTTASSNIAKASTGVVQKAQCWTWDQNLSTASFLPSY